MTNSEENKILKITEYLESAMDVLGLQENESTINTPKRIAKMWVTEFCKNINNHNLDNLDKQMTLFSCDDTSQEMVIVKDIEFHSMCEHHFLPFSGKITVAYIPNKSIIGLSKIPRVVKFFSQKPQLQERLVREIGKYLFELLDPEFILVKAEATHGCVMCRGAESDCATDTMWSKVNVLNAKESPYALSQYYTDHFFKRMGVN